MPRAVALALLPAVVLACKEEPSAPKLAQFGDRCNTAALEDSPEHCDEDLICLRKPELQETYGDGSGYCAELCYEARDCTRKDGNQVICDPEDGVCKFTCKPDQFYCLAFMETALFCEQESGICYDDEI
jgi:hypothetical protein